MRIVLVLLLLVTLSTLAHALNRTYFPRSGGLRRAWAGVNTIRQINVRIRRSSTWEEIGRALRAFESNSNCTVLTLTQTIYVTHIGLECYYNTSVQSVSAVTQSAILPILPASDWLVEENYKMSHTTSVQTASMTWHLDRMDSHPRIFDGQFHYDFDGTGIVVYHFDTGIYFAHNEFQPGNRAIDWLNTLTGGSAADDHGHGSHTAALAVGQLYGVAKGATIKAGKVLDSAGDGTVDSVVAGLVAAEEECANTNMGVVATLSLNGPPSSILDAAIQDLKDHCHSCIAVAAGNSATDACLSSPARMTSILSVAAFESGSDALTDFSNFGSCTALAAPGRDIISAGITGVFDIAIMSGTSMATPLVAGTCAAVLQKHGPATGGSSNIGTEAQNVVKSMATATGYSTAPSTRLFSWVSSAPPPPPGQPPPPPPIDNGLTNNGPLETLTAHGAHVVLDAVLLWLPVWFVAHGL